MADEETTGTPDTGSQQEAPSRVHHHIVRGISHEIRENGDGSLLAQTVELVDRRNKASLGTYGVENGVEDVPIVFAPDGDVTVLSPAEIDPYRSKPLFRSGTAKLGSLDALIDYTNRYKGVSTVLFADDSREAPRITTVFDYHEAGPVENGGQRFGRHRATYPLPLSDEWQAWQSLNGKQISMPNFARFLEDRIVDVLGIGEISLSPTQQQFVDQLGGIGIIADPAKLMELASGLRVYENSQVSQAVNLSSGEAEVIFSASHTDGQGGKLVIPKLFVLAIPVFRHDAPYQIVVRLRYRKEGGITFIYELWRDDLVFDHAFDQAVAKASEGTTLIGFRGSPSI